MSAIITMEEFIDVKNIKTRDELDTVWNYWVHKLKYLKKINWYNNTIESTTENINNIRKYIDELCVRDKELIKEIRSFAIKERAAKKESEKIALNLEIEKDKLEYQSFVDIITKEIEQDKKLKSELRSHIESSNNQVKIFEQKMEKYAAEIGLTALREELKCLESEVSKPIKTSCKHRNIVVKDRRYSAGDSYYLYNCKDCDITFWDEAHMWSDFKKKNWKFINNYDTFFK